MSVSNTQKGLVARELRPFNGTSTEPPAEGEPLLYAIATLVLSKNYFDTAMSLCASIHVAADHDLPGDLELIAYVHDPINRKIDVEKLAKCYTHVIELPLVTVSRPSNFERFKEQYIKLRLWRQLRYERILYMDADFNVVQFKPLYNILHSSIDFGAVQDWDQGAWAGHWNGGFLLLKPDTDAANKVFDNVGPFIAANRFNTEMSEQGYLSAYFDKLGFTLPTIYNLNLAILYQNEAAWRAYVNDAVAIHYTWIKPWSTEDRQYPFDLWHKNLAIAQKMIDGVEIAKEKDAAGLVVVEGGEEKVA